MLVYTIYIYIYIYIHNTYVHVYTYIHMYMYAYIIYIYIFIHTTHGLYDCRYMKKHVYVYTATNFISHLAIWDVFDVEGSNSWNVGNEPRKALYPMYTGENVIIEDVKDRLWNTTKIQGGYVTRTATGHWDWARPDRLMTGRSGNGTG